MVLNLFLCPCLTFSKCLFAFSAGPSPSVCCESWRRLSALSWRRHSLQTCSGVTCIGKGIDPSWGMPTCHVQPQDMVMEVWWGAQEERGRQMLKNHHVRLWGHQAGLGGRCFPCGMICAMWAVKLSRVLASWPCCLEGIIGKHKKAESKKWRSEECSPSAGIKPSEGHRAES